MNIQDNATNTTTASVLERIAQSILVAHAWVSGPAMSERERVQRELVKAEATGNTGAGIAG